MSEPGVRTNAKGVTTIDYLIFKELDHTAICQSLGLRVDPSRPKRKKHRDRRR